MQSESIVCAEMITDEKTRNKKKKKLSPRIGFEPGPFVFKVLRLNQWATEVLINLAGKYCLV